MTTCIIGDIHGCYESLSSLLEQVAGRADTMVFLGDYIDRGPDTKKVIDRLLALQQEHRHVVCLKGNHELMLELFLAGNDHFPFLEVGGVQTLASYGLDPGMPRDKIRAALPASHRAFFASLCLHWQDRHAIYVHAGLQPGRHLTMQNESWCLWARDRFIQSDHDFGKPVVFGHTVFEQPLVQANKIGIDTGAAYGGRLTALLLPEMEWISVEGEHLHPYRSATCMV